MLFLARFIARFQLLPVLPLLSEPYWTGMAHTEKGRSDVLVEIALLGKGERSRKLAVYVLGTTSCIS